MKNDIADLIAEFSEKAAAVYEKKTSLDRQIKKLEQKSENLKTLGAGDFIRGPLRDTIQKEYPSLTVEVLGPFGLGAHYGIHLNNEKSETVASCTLYATNRWDEPLELSLLLTEETDAYPRRSLAAMNGLNRKSAPFPASTAELRAFFDPQIADRQNA